MNTLQDKQNLLLHCCCAPCAVCALERLESQYNISIYFYNPNIEPFTEHEKRRKELDKLPFRFEVFDCGYDNTFFSEIAGSLRGEPEGGQRCAACFGLRLEETAKRAAAEGITLFATTLTTGPQKNTELINRTGRKAAEKYGLTYLDSDFKKQDGYKRSVELSKQYGLYRQAYCGCIITK